jgi:hypothetical protein
MPKGVILNASKTKIVVNGLKQDMEYYQDVSPGTLADNDHLGILIQIFIVFHLSEKQVI